MGGPAGHMMHLYENPSLTFREIKDIFKKINDGKLLVTEKVDGKNLLLSYSFTEGRAKAARNHQHIIDGGVVIENVDNLLKYKDGQESFAEALKIFENTVKKFSIDDQIELFGPNTNYYYNCEIQDPNSLNVLNYDRGHILVHRSGHLKRNKFDNSIVQEVLSKEFLKFEKLLKENVQLNEASNDRLIVRTNDIRTVGPLTNKTCYENALKSLQNEMLASGVSDSASLAEYILNRLDEAIDNKINLSKQTKTELLKRLMKVEGVTAKHVYTSLNKENRADLIEQVKQILDSEKTLLKEAIRPIEEIVAAFSAGVLSEFQSSYIKDPIKEINRIKTKLTEIFDIVGNSGNVDAQNYLNNQFGRIKDINNINSACEGFVFKYNNDIYKMTGMFSALNQILGMMDYPRGNIPALKTLIINKQPMNIGENKTAVISFGRFNPPTIGHEVVFKVASVLAQQSKADFFIVPTKTNDKQKNPLTIQEKISYFNKIFPEYNSNILNNTNINTIFDAAKYLSEQGYKNLKVIVGSDRKDQFEILNKYNNKDYTFKTIEIVSAGERLDESEGVESVSATKARKAAIDGDVESFMKNFAGRLELEEGVKLMNLIRSRIEIVEDNKKKVLQPLTPSLLSEVIRKSGNKWCVFSKKKSKKTGKKKKLGCYNSRSGAKKRLRQVEYFKNIKEQKELQEISMAGGIGIEGNVKQDDLEETTGAGGYVDAPGLSATDSKLGISSKRDDEPSRKERIKVLIMQEEQFMVNRKEFIEEIKLRKVVREALKRKMKQREEKILQEEKQLRLIIRKLLQEKEEEVPHKITGINILKDVLKKIVPTIEKDYKNLTTNKKQRVSFRAHLLNATKNIFVLSDTPEEHINVDVQQKELEEEADPNTPDDPKFIAVRPKSKAVVDQPEEVDTYSIEGLDTTGRDMSKKCWKKIGKQIEDAYDGLSDEKDKEAFRDYLITNLKLHMDIFENELNVDVEEPTTPEYENEKQKLDANQPESDATSDLSSSNPEQAPPVSPNPSPEQPVMESKKRR